MSIERSLKADTQLAETGQPAVSAFDDPAMTTELLATLDTSASDTRSDSTLEQRQPAVRKVIAFIRMDFVWTLPWPPRHARNRRYGVQDRFEHLRVMPIGAADHPCQRNTLPVYRDVTLAPELAPIRRVRPGFFAPRGLATLAPSMLTRLQSKAPYPRNRASNA
jgi:hypothetical protein